MDAMTAPAIRVGKRFVEDFMEDDVLGLSAELAYRFLFAVFPFGIFLAALGAFVAQWIGIADPTEQILDALGDNLPPDVAQTIRPQLEAVIGQTQPGLLTFGAVGALWAATGGTNALIKAMNRAYEVEEGRPFIKKTAMAVGLTLLASAGILVSFVTIVGASVLTEQIAEEIGLSGDAFDLLTLLRWPVVFVLLAVAVGLLYRLAPNLRPPWRWCFAGGALFALGWLVATAGFAFYVANFSNYGNTYGALGGVIVLMLWFYLSAVVLVGAAELVAVALKELDPAWHEAERQAAREQDAPAPRDDTAAETPEDDIAPPPHRLAGAAALVRPSARRGARTRGRGSDLVPAGLIAAGGLAAGALVAWFIGPKDRA